MCFCTPLSLGLPFLAFKHVRCLEVSTTNLESQTFADPFHVTSRNKKRKSLSTSFLRLRNCGKSQGFYWILTELQSTPGMAPWFEACKTFSLAPAGAHVSPCISTSCKVSGRIIKRPSCVLGFSKPACFKLFWQIAHSPVNSCFL